MMSTNTKRRFKAGPLYLALAMAASAFLNVGAARAQEVVVQGNRSVDNATVQSYVSGAGSLEEARRNLLATGLFSQVRVAREGGRVVVSVHENNVINRVVFEGNKKLTKEQLGPEIQTKARGPLSQQTIDSDVKRLEAIYRQAGRGNTKVSARTVSLPNGRVDVVFTIDESGKTGIREINFVGNNAYSSRRLRELMQLSEMNFLSFLKSNDVYNPDKLASDEDLIRRYYLRNGYADFQILSTDVQYSTEKEGYIITITVSEGEQYRIGSVNLESNVPGVNAETLRDGVVSSEGEIYNADNVSKTLNNVTIEAAREGYPFAQVRPTGQRDPSTHTVNLGYVVEEGPRVYIERINVRGNTRTRDYVIRRELDLGEGDAYNRVLVDRGERRLNNLGYFKKVRISTEPGSAPDRVVVNIDVEDQPTGAFSVSGGYSTSDGVIGEVSVSESNFLGRGQYVRVAGQLGERANGVDFSFTEPYFLGYRVAAGFDLFTKYSDQTLYSRYENRTTGGQLRLGLPVTENFGVTLRYSLFQQDMKIPNTYKRPYNDCSVPLPGYTLLNPDGTSSYPSCAYDGEASVALKESQGRTLTSLAGLTLGYNTLDNVKNPHSGIYAEIKPEVAGLGGDSQYVRVTGDARYYHEVTEDIVGMLRLQGGQISGFGNNHNSSGVDTFGGNLRLVDQFFLGPSLVRGFAPSGIGPRDVSTPDSGSNALGGSTYIGTSLEFQFPLYGLPRDLGLKGAVFADAGTLFGYRGPRGFDINRNGLLDGAACGSSNFSVQPECVTVRDKKIIRSSIGASLLWQSPLGPIRFDYAYALSKDEGVYDPRFGEKVGGDETQAFRFSGGTRF